MGFVLMDPRTKRGFASRSPRANDHCVHFAFPLRNSRTLLSAAVLFEISGGLIGGPACAGPTGGDVVAGSASISTSGNTTKIDQTTQQAIIDWQQFSIAPNETVNFLQPNAGAVTLNRVIGNEASVIAGALNANGKIFIVNSAGILFGKGAQVNVGGLVASTLDISDSDFKAGRYTFRGDSPASVVNQGTIKASEGGYVALLGNNVSNEGTIEATLGTVALAAGQQTTLNFGGKSLVDVTVDKGTLKAVAKNGGIIKADGGRVVMTARAADGLLSAQVNNSGVIQAQTMAGLKGGAARTGSIKLAAIQGAVKVSGRLDASAPKGGNGGYIDTSGNKVTIAKSANITTAAASGKIGSWVIDPDGFTIGAGGDITGAQLSTSLASTNVMIQSTSGSGISGDIDVKDPVNWSADTTLTLDATNDINISAPITATGSNAGLNLIYGGDYVFRNPASSITLSGANPTLQINGQDYTLINSAVQLEAIAPNNGDVSSGFFALGRNIDLAGKVYAGPVIYELDGVLAGMGHTINKLTIRDNAGENLNALIGITGSSAVIRDIGLTNANVFGGTYLTSGGSGAGNAATLVIFNSGLIQNAYAMRGQVTGDTSVGGLVSWNLFDGKIINSYTDLVVKGRTDTGGLVGQNFGLIDSSYANGFVQARGVTTEFGGLTASLNIGGLAGDNFGTISNSHAEVALKAVDATNVGGLVGLNFNPYDALGVQGGAITNSSATGWITVTWGNKTNPQYTSIGGLVGFNHGGTIDKSSADVFITLTAKQGELRPITGAGGLVGYSETNLDGTGGVISNSTSNSNIFNEGYVDAIGGLIGFINGGTVENSTASGQVGSGINTYPNGSGGLIGNVFGDPSSVTLSGNSWNIGTTGQTSAIGGSASVPGVEGTGSASILPPWFGPSALDSASGVNVSAPILGVIGQATRAASVISTTNTQYSWSHPPSASIGMSGAAALRAGSGPTLAQQVSVPSGIATKQPSPEARYARRPARKAQKRRVIGKFFEDDHRAVE